jgi:hypothetical protein
VNYGLPQFFYRRWQPAVSVICAGLACLRWFTESEPPGAALARRRLLLHIGPHRPARTNLREVYKLHFARAFKF